MGKLGETAIIVCSRPDSKRVPRKVFTEFPLGKNKKTTLLMALLSRLKMTGLPIILAIPKGSGKDYESYLSMNNVHLFVGYGDDPLKRMSEAAKKYEVKNIIRVCHDKIFIDPILIKRALGIYENMAVDYLYSSFFIEGTGFEIIHGQCLHLASSIYKNVEHISYAIKAVTKNVYNWAIPMSERCGHRILVDTPKDIKVIQKIFERFKTKTIEVSLYRILEFLRIHPEITAINKQPEATIYTCVYNCEKYIEECIKSVVRQKNFNEYEYIIVNDKSKDESLEIINEYAKRYENIKIVNNKKNIGLSSSSNIALSMARGKYITRIDADDYYPSKNAVRELINCIKHSDMDAIYPANYFGSKKTIQSGEENHHVGGAIFNRRSINDIKFTDGLRGYEGLDFFHRARNYLRIGYLANPIFFYRQHDKSLSKDKSEKRKQIKEKISNDYRTAMA